MQAKAEPVAEARPTMMLSVRLSAAAFESRAKLAVGSVVSRAPSTPLSRVLHATATLLSATHWTGCLRLSLSLSLKLQCATSSHTKTHMVLSQYGRSQRPPVAAQLRYYLTGCHYATVRGVGGTLH